MKHRVRIDKDGTFYVDDVKSSGHLSQREASIVDAVLKRRGMMATDELMTALYGLENDWPDRKIMTVFVCHIRRKFGVEHTGVISTVWGRGFQAGEGYVLEPSTATASVDLPASLIAEIAEIALEADMTTQELTTELLRGALPQFRKRLWAPEESAGKSAGGLRASN